MLSFGLLHLVAACGGDDGSAEAQTGAPTASSEGTLQGSSSTTGGGTHTSSTGSTGPGTGEGSMSGSTGGDGSDGSGATGSESAETSSGGWDASSEGSASEVVGSSGSGSETGPPDDGTIFFRTEEPSAYAAVDRVGLPGVSHLHIASPDEYNRSTPVDDVERAFVTEVRDSIDALQIGEGVDGDGLRAEIEALGFVPCEPPEAEVLDPPVECNRQVYPHVIPDVLGLDLDEANGFPNGRQLEDRAMDLTLGLVLLDLDEALLGYEDENSPGGHPLDAFFDIGGGVSLNPTSNDRPFSSGFPYLAPPHE